MQDERDVGSTQEPEDRVPIGELEDPGKTPPLQMRGYSVVRAFAIVLAFTVAGSLVWVLLTETGGGLVISWTQYLSVPGFVVGVVVAAADYLWRR